ncbi:unnamed protein product [Diabrotica balteata]|uniref:Methuselah N-terminal domain-containing protein n=1 Tax=Diabrotica balteata TaxID=107213 RepID=A0A9N9T561_DIABA|nr:unnamed protein product [Diabrotica balteata]
MDIHIFLSLLIICSVCWGARAYDPCSIMFEIDISTTTFGTCNPLDDYRIRRCICKVRKCIRRCCYDDKSRNIPDLCFEEDLKPSFRFYNNTDLYSTSDLSEYYITSGNPNCEPEADTYQVAYEDYYMQEDGEIFYTTANKSYGIKSYCLLSNIAFICQISGDREPEEILYIRRVQLSENVELSDKVHKSLDDSYNFSTNIRKCSSEKCVSNMCCHQNQNVLCEHSTSDDHKVLSLPNYCKEVIHIASSDSVERFQNQLYIKQKKMYLNMNELCVLTGTDKCLSLCVRKSNVKRFSNNGTGFKNSELQNQLNSNIKYRKCCKDGEVILKKPCFYMGQNITKLFNSKLQKLSRNDKYYHEDLKCGSNFAKARVEDFKFTPNGSIFWESGDYYIDQNLFCVELYTVDKTNYFLHALACVSENEITNSYQMPVWGMLFR